MYKRSSNPITLDKEPLKILTNQIINDLDRYSDLDLPYTNTYHLDVASSLNDVPKKITVKVKVIDGEASTQLGEDASFDKNKNEIFISLDYNYYLNANDAIYFNELLIVLYHESIHAIQINNSDIPEWISGLPYYNKIDEYEAYLGEIDLNMEENYAAIARIAIKAKLNKFNTNSFVIKVLTNLLSKNHLKSLVNRIDKDTYNKYIGSIIKDRYKELKAIYNEHYISKGFDINEDDVKAKIMSGIKKEINKDFMDTKFKARKDAYNKFLSFVYKKINDNSDIIFKEMRRFCLSNPNKFSDKILSYKTSFPNIFDWLRS